jgi:hypothetical protein
MKGDTKIGIKEVHQKKHKRRLKEKRKEKYNK